MYDDLDKGKIYCKFCYFLDPRVLTEITVSSQVIVKHCDTHKHLGGNFRSLSYSLELGEWQEYRGFVLARPVSSYKKNTDSGECCICGSFNQVRDGSGRGSDGVGNGGCDCSIDYFREFNSSPRMRRVSSIQMALKHQSGLMSDHMKRLNSYELSYCKICRKDTHHNDFGLCVECRLREHNLSNSGICKRCRVYVDSRHPLNGMCKDCSQEAIKERIERNKDATICLSCGSKVDQGSLHPLNGNCLSV